jgi:hypothetical protein
MKLNLIDRRHMAPSTEDIPIQIRDAKYQYLLNSKLGGKTMVD